MLSLLTSLVLTASVGMQSTPELIPLLRETRAPGWPGAAAVQEDVTRAVLADVSVAIECLVARQVPAIEDEDASQILSEVQRDMILDALEFANPTELLLIAERLEADARLMGEAPTAALWILGASGRARDVVRAIDWTNRAILDERYDSSVRPAIRRCMAHIVQRDPASLDWLGTAFVQAERETLMGAIPAMGDIRDPRALEPLIEVVLLREDSQGLALSQIQRVGRSLDIGLNQRTCDAIRPLLSSESGTLQQAAARSLAILGDTSMAPTLIEFLEDGDRGLKDAAGWALTALAGRRIGTTAADWSAWFERERQWRDEKLSSLQSGLRSRESSEQAKVVLVIAQRELYADEWARTLMEVAPSTPQVKILICRSLGELGAVSAFPFLLETARNGSKELREACKAAMELILGEPLPVDEAEWDSVLQTS